MATAMVARRRNLQPGNTVTLSTFADFQGTPPYRHVRCRVLIQDARRPHLRELWQWAAHSRSRSRREPVHANRTVRATNGP